MQGTLQHPRKLAKQDLSSLEDFASGSNELDTWLKKYSWQNQRANNAVVYVSTLDTKIVGFYALAAAGVSKEELGEDFGKRRPTDIPCILLARLAVDSKAQNRGVGRSLLVDAIKRAREVSDSIGAAALIVHCQDLNAKKFYQRSGNGLFLPFPGDELKLMLPI
ncbi:GNAT family N-acetyltransferase [Arcanobacterium phocae]|uniref:GNAT family N-acetyltransferase n=1 Tax=Arcanobacterium phocae TaxID=131112 RepID=UPI001C0F217A|nr:GNAT family N-acetyltransferase [Arcanobacterium phocae]